MVVDVEPGSQPALEGVRAGHQIVGISDAVRDDVSGTAHRLRSLFPSLRAAARSHLFQAAATVSAAQPYSLFVKHSLIRNVLWWLLLSIYW